jgi:outer membrane protein insertion porin family
MKVGWTNGIWRIAVVALLSGATLAHSEAKQDASQATSPNGPIATVSSTNGAPVLAVRVVTEDGRVLSESPAGITVEIGKPLDPARVSESLRALYRTGDYDDLRAAATPVEGGMRLDFVVHENLFFNQVLIRGLTAPPTEASAAAAMQLSLGQVYRRSAVDEALDRLRDTLHDEGLYTAQASAEAVPHADTHQMDIVVRVKPGPRARVGEIRLMNGTEYRDSEILSRLKMKRGSELTSARVQRGTDRIRKFLVKKGHLSARATVRRGAYDGAKNTVSLQIEVTEGPLVRVAVAGAKFSGGELKKLIPIYQEGAVDADLLEEGKRNLSDRLERQTYFDAEVNYSIETREVKRSGGGQGTEQVITYRVERGVRHNLVGIEIAGNRYFDTELLRSRLQIFGGAFGSRGRFSRRLVDSDAQSMRGLYQANGFLDASVEGRIQDNYQGKEGNVYVRFEVLEGAQTRVASLSIEGNHALKDEELLGVIGATPGQAYSDFNVTSDRDNILALYFNEGFPEAQFTATAERVPQESAANSGNTTGSANEKEEKKKSEGESGEETKPTIAQAPPVRLVYHIGEGPQTLVRRIYVSGYQRTRQGVIRREVRMKPSEPLREGDVVETQRRLYNLGIFNRVTVQPQNPAGSDPDKDIVVLVEEAKRYTVAYGGGFEVQRLASTTNPTGAEVVRAAPRGILELTKNNLTGRADSLSLKLRGSTLQWRALLGYSAPNTFGDSHLSFQTTAFVEKAQDINTFTVTRYEGSVQLTDQINRLSTLLYRYTFRKVIVTNLNIPIPSDEIPLFNQPTLVSGFGMTWFRDARDNPADPVKGSFNSADISFADTTIGSSASFLRFFYQNSTYHPIKRRFSFARSLRFGILQPYRETVSLTFPAPTTRPLPTVIPLPERFFGGGGTSLRGFALNQAGPRDTETGFPVGGQALLVLNQEFRFPMHLPFIGAQLGGTLFYDGGNTYSRLSRISFRATLPKPTFTFAPNPANPTGPPLTTCVTNCSNELNYFAHTIGFGIRYATPVGPIRVDAGYLVNRPFFVVPCVSATSTTPASTNCFKGTQLPRLQIFFSLGSSF